MKTIVKDKIVAGVVSDTHGLLRPEVIELFEKVDIILHAGDVGNDKVLTSLEEIAPVIAVKGNVDEEGGLAGLPLSVNIKLGKCRVEIVHNIRDLNESSMKKNDIIIFGHSHKPVIEGKEEIILFNPGSAGRKRFSLPVSAGLLFIYKNEVKPELRFLNI